MTKVDVRPQRARRKAPQKKENTAVTDGMGSWAPAGGAPRQEGGHGTVFASGQPNAWHAGHAAADGRLS